MDSGRRSATGSEDRNGTLDRGLDTKHGCVCYLRTKELLVLRTYFILIQISFFRKNQLRYFTGGSSKENWIWKFAPGRAATPTLAFPTSNAACERGHARRMVKLGITNAENLVLKSISSSK
jgi:hypothetical protein